jgi:hypothetical protein
MTAFDYEPLYNKSKVYIERAIRLHAAGDLEMCQLWASLALELVAKAALAKIHPALVADPQDVDSLFAACGRSFSTTRKSILAKTVFDRLRHVNPNFMQGDKDFCMDMANRRNAELHSGELPFAGMREGAWIPKFWRVCKLILDAQGKTLTDWLGVEEAAKAEAAIQTVKTAEVVEGKFRTAADAFGRAYPTDEAKGLIRATTKFINTSWQPLFGRSPADAFQAHQCPVCKCEAAVSGERWNEEISAVERPDEPWVELVETTYVTSGFRCTVCQLKLDGREEMDLAGIEKEFVLTEEREPDYEPDYGND